MDVHIHIDGRIATLTSFVFQIKSQGPNYQKHIHKRSAAMPFAPVLGLALRMGRAQSDSKTVAWKGLLTKTVANTCLSLLCSGLPSAWGVPRVTAKLLHGMAS